MKIKSIADMAFVALDVLNSYQITRSVTRMENNITAWQERNSYFFLNTFIGNDRKIKTYHFIGRHSDNITTGNHILTINCFNVNFAPSFIPADFHIRYQCVPSIIPRDALLAREHEIYLWSLCSRFYWQIKFMRTKLFVECNGF